MDVTNKQSLYTYGRLEEADVNFDLKEEQQRKWDRLRSHNTFLRAEHHNIHTLLWKPGFLRNIHLYGNDETSVHLFPSQSNSGPDSCRFSGTISVNKVAGNFHISAGKYLPLPIGHAHVSLIGSSSGK